ncbi:hypothetical protein D3C77_350040 [compost metagenome]
MIDELLPAKSPAQRGTDKPALLRMLEAHPLPPNSLLAWDNQKGLLGTVIKCLYLPVQLLDSLDYQGKDAGLGQRQVTIMV